MFAVKAHSYPAFVYSLSSASLLSLLCSVIRSSGGAAIGCSARSQAEFWSSSAAL